MSTARDIIGDNRETRLEAMAWANGDDCNTVCHKLGITHAEYLEALKYINRSGIVRGFFIIKELSRRLRS